MHTPDALKTVLINLNDQFKKISMVFVVEIEISLKEN